jgi:DNA-binding response OmpR family regulator
MKEQVPAPGAAPRILVVDADRLTLGLLEEWLRAAGYEVVKGQADDAATPEGVALAIVDVPFARSGVERLQRFAARHAGTPILALSPTFFSHVKCIGDCARSLGVSGVLPKPVARDALITAIEDLLRPAG